jgi:ABC-type sugar transport system permease subunit
MGYASAMAVVLALIMMAVTLIQFRLLRAEAD